MSLANWANSRKDASRAERARDVARRIAMVVRAFGSGLSGEVGLPGAAKVKLDAGKVIDSLGDAEEDDDGQSEAARFGRDYVKKIFQVPYSLPPTVTDQLAQLLEYIYADDQLPPRLGRDLRRPPVRCGDGRRRHRPLPQRRRGRASRDLARAGPL